MKTKRVKFMLCCGSKNCPIVTQLENEPNKFSITDDYGGQITLTKAELIELSSKIKEYGLDNIS